MGLWLQVKIRWLIFWDTLVDEITRHRLPPGTLVIDLNKQTARMEKK